MSYEGEVIGNVDGIEVRQLTEAEVAKCGGQKYCLVGYSHWNPASFFASYADELDRKAELHRMAGRIIAHIVGLAEIDPKEPSE